MSAPIGLSPRSYIQISREQSIARGGLPMVYCDTMFWPQTWKTIIRYIQSRRMYFRIYTRSLGVYEGFRAIVLYGKLMITIVVSKVSSCSSSHVAFRYRFPSMAFVLTFLLKSIADITRKCVEYDEKSPSLRYCIR